MERGGWSWLAAAGAAAALVFLIVLGSGLRLAGIDAGNPYVYHPDEWYIAKNAMNMVRDLDPLPHFYMYPSLLILLVTLVVAVVHGLGGPTLDTSQAWLLDREVLPEQFVYFLAARGLVALLGLLTILAVYAIGSRLRGRAAGVAAAAIVAVAPLHVENSRYSTTDVPVALAVGIALLVTMRAIERQRDRWWVAAGVAAGLAGSTKWTGLAVLGVPLLACLLTTARPTDFVAFARRRAPWLIMAAAAITVLAVTPGVVLEPRTFISGLLQLRRNYSIPIPGREDTIPAAVASLADGVGGPLVLALAIAGLGLIVARRRPAELPLAAFAVVFFAVAALTPRQYDRNLLPLLPCLAVAAAIAVSWIRPWIARRLAGGSNPPGTAPSLIAGVLAAGLLCVAVGPAAVRQLSAAQQPSPPDTRTIAVDWVRANIPAGSGIAREGYTPQVGPEYRVERTLFLSDRTLADYRRLGVRFLIASDSAYFRFLVPGASPTATAFYQELFALPEVGRVERQPGQQGPLIRIFELRPT
jgi:hypothetical protein